MNYRQSADFARSSSTYWHRFGDGDFFGMTTIGAGQKVARDTRGLENVKTAAAWTGATGVVGATFYGIGYGLNALWQNSPSSAEFVEWSASAGQQVAEVAKDCLGVVQSGSEAVASFVDPTGIVAVVGVGIFSIRLGLVIHNLQNIDNAMPGSHHNCVHYNLKKVRNCLLEALGIMCKGNGETYSDSAIQELVNKVNNNREVEKDPNKKEIDGFDRFVLEKILKEIGNNGGISNGGLDDSKLIKFLTISKSNLGPLDFDKLSSEYGGIDQSIFSKVKAGTAEVKAFVTSSLLLGGDNCFSPRQK